MFVRWLLQWLAGLPALTLAKFRNFAKVLIPRQDELLPPIEAALNQLSTQIVNQVQPVIGSTVDAVASRHSTGIAWTTDANGISAVGFSSEQGGSR